MLNYKLRIANCLLLGLWNSFNLGLHYLTVETDKHKRFNDKSQ